MTLRVVSSSATERRDCVCGACITVSSRPASVADELVALFERVHSGEGHGATDPMGSQAGRRRAERAARGEAS